MGLTDLRDSRCVPVVLIKAVIVLPLLYTPAKRFFTRNKIGENLTIEIPRWRRSQLSAREAAYQIGRFPHVGI